MYALTWNSLRTGLPMTGHAYYATEYEAAEAAVFLENYYAGRGFHIPHAVVRVDAPAADSAAEPVTGRAVLGLSAVSEPGGAASYPHSTDC